MCSKLIYSVLLVSVLGTAPVQAQDVEWIRAAYWDSNYRTNWADEATSVAVRDRLIAAGYEVLDAVQLKAWMDARIADKKFSVVVFCRDNAPDTVVETVDSDCTLRKYLDAGGKIVFYADIPFWDIGHADGTYDNPQTAGASNILGFDNTVVVWDTNQQVTITPAGARWGLTQGWASIRPVSPSVVDVVLATDGAGNAAAWVKHYVKGDTFRGFVRIYDRPGQPNLDDIVRVAEYVGLKASNPEPANGAPGVILPLLRWEAGSFAVWHDVYLGTSPELGPDDYRTRTPGIVTMYYHSAGLEPGTTYYWRIDEVSADGTVVTGDVWSFTVTPQAAWAPEPADGAKYIDPEIVLGWSPGMSATGHDVYFGTDRAAVEAGAADTLKGSVVAPSFEPPALERATTYYWRVDEQAGAGTVTGSVWSFTVRPVIEKANPNLIGWWKLDDELSGTAVDYSGYDHYGELRGNPQWVEGYHGDALSFDGVDDYVDFGSPNDWPEGAEPRTLCGWGKTDTLASGWRWIAAYGSPATSQAMFIGLNGTALYGGGYGDDVSTDDFWEIGEWRHICLTYDGATARLYADGVEVVSAPKTWNLVRSRAHIGRQVNTAAEFWDGMIDDVRLYDIALTPEQVQETMRGDPAMAWNPQPRSGAEVDIRDATGLSWAPGETAAEHDVYFGTDKDVVKAADASSPEYQGRQSGTDFSPAGQVEFGGGAYFWRIDEVEADGATVHTGVVWGFTIPDYLIVDDFESYTDDEGDRIYETWIDGYADQSSGSTVGNLEAPFAEQQIVHGGKQSMPFEYNNVNSPWFSEAYREFSPVQNWTTHGVDSLSLWFQGAPVAYAETAPGAFTMSASGTDIWNTADEFRFAYKRLSGNGSIVARVESLVQTDGWAKAGVMIRESLYADSKHAAVVVTPSNGVSFPYRAYTTDVSNQVNTAGLQAPYWVKLTRTGDVFKAEHSADGKAWTALGTEQTVVMTGTIYIGLCLTSHNATAVTTAQFTDVATTGGVSGAWQVAEIGVDHPGNSTDQFYLAVEDSAGKVVVLTHPDPAAVNVATWTQWRIPLSDLAGVNLTRVKRLYLGVGDRQTPQPDGAGRLYIDDIHLLQPAPTP